MNSPFVSLELWGGLFGGLALFLFGMDLMTKALKVVAGDHMKDLLGFLLHLKVVLQKLSASAEYTNQ